MNIEQILNMYKKQSLNPALHRTFPVGDVTHREALEKIRAAYFRAVHITSEQVLCCVGPLPCDTCKGSSFVHFTRYTTGIGLNYPLLYSQADANQGNLCFPTYAFSVFVTLPEIWPHSFLSPLHLTVSSLAPLN
jgi:hypothetical protein